MPHLNLTWRFRRFDVSIGRLLAFVVLIVQPRSRAANQLRAAPTTEQSSGATWFSSFQKGTSVLESGPKYSENSTVESTRTELASVPVVVPAPVEQSLLPYGSIATP